MSPELDKHLGKYKYLIGLIIIVSTILLWMKPRTKDDCQSLTPKFLVKACLAELPAANYRFQPEVTPPTTPPLAINFARLEFTGVKLEPEVSGTNTHYILSGNLQNKSTNDLKNILIIVSYYNFGDNPDQASPIGQYTINVKEVIPAGQSQSIKVPATSDSIRLPNTSFSWNWKIDSAEIVDPL